MLVLFLQVSILHSYFFPDNVCCDHHYGSCAKLCYAQYQGIDIKFFFSYILRYFTYKITTRMLKRQSIFFALF